MQFYPTGGRTSIGVGSETPDRILDFKRFSGGFPLIWRDYPFSGRTRQFAPIPALPVGLLEGEFSLRWRLSVS